MSHVFLLKMPPDGLENLRCYAFCTKVLAGLCIVKFRSLKFNASEVPQIQYYLTTCRSPQENGKDNNVEVPIPDKGTVNLLGTSGNTYTISKKHTWFSVASHRIFKGFGLLQLYHNQKT
jgi:hypothetical protein